MDNWKHSEFWAPILFLSSEATPEEKRDPELNTAGQVPSSALTGPYD